MKNMMAVVFLLVAQTSIHALASGFGGYEDLPFGSGSGGATGATGATGSIGSIGVFSTTSTANGLDVTGSVLTLHAADGTNPGALTTAAQTIAGAKTFTSVLVAPSGTVSAPGVQVGNGANGIYAGSGTTVVIAPSGIAGVEVGVGPGNTSWLNIGTFKGSTAGQSLASSVNFTNPNGAALSASVGLLNYATTAQEFYESIANKIFFAVIKDGQGSMCFQSNSSGSIICGYLPYEYVSNSSDTAYNTASSTGMYKTFVGSNDTNAVIITRNAFNGAGTFGGIGNADSTLIGTTNQGPFINGALLWFNDTQNTLGNNGVSHIEISTTSAGVRANVMKIGSGGQILYGGTAITLTTCGASPTIIKATDHSGRITVQSSSCTINFANAFPNIPACWARDETTAVTFTGAPTTALWTLSGMTTGDTVSFGCDGNF